MGTYKETCYWGKGIQVMWKTTGDIPKGPADSIRECLVGADEQSTCDSVNWNCAIPNCIFRSHHLGATGMEKVKLYKLPCMVACLLCGS